MKPIKFKECNAVFAKDQPQYLQLPAHRDFSQWSIITSCWKLTWLERFEIFFKGKFWFQQVTFKNPLQPQKPSIKKPLL
jgi:hypothetical protein